jgi:hypothetical protein
MKLIRKEGESQYDWNMRQVDESLRQANKNLDQVDWMWKWLLIPMWSLILIMWIIKLIMHKHA